MERVAGRELKELRVPPNNPSATQAQPDCTPATTPPHPPTPTTGAEVWWSPATALDTPKHTTC